jgi:Family of unknown function (DUF5330)
MGLFRKAIVLGGVIFAMPSPPASGPLTAVQPNTQASTFATLAAAAETVADVKGFCERRPQACVTGQYLAVTLEGKARYGVKLAYEWANAAKGETIKVEAPALRLATLSEAKPQTIDDLLRKTTSE